MLVAGADGETVEGSRLGVGTQGDLVGVAQAGLLHEYGQGAGSGVFQGDLHFELVRLGWLPGRFEGLAMLVLHGELVDAGGGAGLQVEHAGASYDKSAFVGGRNGPGRGLAGSQVETGAVVMF